MAAPTKPRDGEPIRLVFTSAGAARYRVVLDAPAHADGKRRQVRSTHRTLTAAREHVEAHRSDRSRGVLVTPNRETFNQAADDYIARKVRQRREVTVTSYKAALTHPKAAFGTRRLVDVTASDVERMVAKLHALGRSKRTAALVLFVTRAVFEDAVRAKTIGSNPARWVEPTGVEAKEREGLSAAEIAKLRKHLATDRLFACWLLTLNGLRRSEVMGLKWTDVDLKAKTLSVSRGRVLADGKRTVEGKTKTARGVRTLPLSAELLAALKQLRKKQLAEFGSQQVRTGFLAVDGAGVELRPERWSDLWRDHCVTAGVSQVSLHGARHSSVTAMRNAGVPGHLIAAWHGHDEVVMRRTYSHSDPEGLSKAGEALSKAYGAPDL